MRLRIKEPRHAIKRTKLTTFPFDLYFPIQSFVELQLSILNIARYALESNRYNEENEEFKNLPSLDIEGMNKSAGGAVMESNDQALIPSAQPAARATPNAVVSGITDRAKKT